MSWEWVPCGNLIQGNIKMLQKPGGTAYYQAFSFSNTKQVGRAGPGWQLT